MPKITDPADRLGAEFDAALEKRYADIATATVPDIADRYANVCDLMVQLLWPERYGTGTDDPLFHTSAPARAIARLIFHAAGIDGEPERP
jgi:hypothetical protein